ncbi:MAG: hypothetical protein II789_02230, partial [Clostridia bacterium]|nr:hypothetical protein [Clostridia bacterium]
RIAIRLRAAGNRSMWSAAPSDPIRGRILPAAPHSRSFFPILAHFYPAFFDFLILNHFSPPQGTSLELRRHFKDASGSLREISRAMRALTHAFDRSEKAPFRVCGPGTVNATFCGIAIRQNSV